MSATRFFILVGLAIVLMILASVHEKKMERKASKIAKIASVLTLLLALIKGGIVILFEIAHIFWSV